MKTSIYVKIAEWLANRPRLTKFINCANHIITWISILAYPVLLAFFAFTKDAALFRAIVVPLDGFIILSVFRALYNRPRPYETFAISPAIKKDTKGKSFPSRHVFSATVIAMTFLLWSPWPAIGVLLLVFAVLLAVIRVLTSVHFISDVCVGALFGVLCAILGYIVI